MGLTMADMFPGKWLKAEEFEEGETRVVTIKDVDFEELGQGAKMEKKPVLSFRDSKPLVLNKTNGSIIEHLYGPDTDDWIGKKITLYTMEVDSFGDIVRAVRVKNQVPKEIQRVAPNSAANGGITPQDMAAVWGELQREAAEAGLTLKDLPPNIPVDKFQEWQIKAREQINAARPVAVAPAAQSHPMDDYDDSDPFADS